MPLIKNMQLTTIRIKRGSILIKRIRSRTFYHGTIKNAILCSIASALYIKICTVYNTRSTRIGQLISASSLVSHYYFIRLTVSNNAIISTRNIDPSSNDLQIRVGWQRCINVNIYWRIGHLITRSVAT